MNSIIRSLIGSRIQATCASLLGLILGASGVSAGGYAIPEQTARATSLANSVTAGVTDPSAVYVNPAALNEIQGNRIIGGVSYINTVSSVNNSGRKSVNKHDNSFIPTLFANYHIPDTDLTYGMGLYSPFGLATTYAEDAFTRFGAVRSALKTLYLTHAMAWRLNPSLSIGGGLSFVRASALFSRTLFLGGDPDRDPQGQLRLTGTDQDFAFNLGVLFKPTDKVKIGLTYRSRANLNFSDAKAKASPGSVSRARAKGVQVPLPPVISAGLNWQITDSWDVEFVYDYVRWSEFPHLKARFNPPLLGGTLSGLFIEELWKNTSTLRLGSSYQLNDVLELRVGITADESPIPSRTLGASIPGADLLVLGVGVGYSWKNFILDVGYMAIIYKSRNVLNNTLEANQTNPIAPGQDRYETFQNFVSLHLQYRF